MSTSSPVRIDDTWYHRNPGLPENIAAGGVVIRAESDTMSLALIRDEGFPGYILPKGHIEYGESLEEAAIREIGEESGLIDLTLLGYLGMRERMDFTKRSWKITHYFLFTTAQREGRPTDPDHSYHLTWFDIRTLPEMFWPEQRDLIESGLEMIVRLVNAARPPS